jgi:hypothetical protein
MLIAAKAPATRAPRRRISRHAKNPIGTSKHTRAANTTPGRAPNTQESVSGAIVAPHSSTLLTNPCTSSSSQGSTSAA